MKFSRGIDGAYLEQTSAFVFAGLPTTNTFTVFLAYLSSASPCNRTRLVKICSHSSGDENLKIRFRFTPYPVARSGAMVAHSPSSVAPSLCMYHSFPKGLLSNPEKGCMYGMYVLGMYVPSTEINVVCTKKHLA